MGPGSIAEPDWLVQSRGGAGFGFVDCCSASAIRIPDIHPQNRSQCHSRTQRNSRDAFGCCAQ
jgi:hypothetical protein